MLMLLLAAMTEPAVAPPLPPAPPEKCERATVQHAGLAPPARIQPLSKEPPARREVALAYSENGCLKPITIANGSLRKLPDAK